MNDAGMWSVTVTAEVEVQVEVEQPASWPHRFDLAIDFDLE